MRYRILALIFVAASVFQPWNTEAQNADYGADYGIFSFEGSDGCVSESKGSSTALSDWHSKLGTCSLQWDWIRKGASISFDTEIPYLPENPNPKETSVSSFVFWIYCPEKIDGSLRFTFHKDGKECCGFTYGLDFNGWRGAWVAFDRDMEGTPEIGMDRITITAPENVRTGRVYIDGMIPASFQDVRYHTPDFQAPFINRSTTSHWLILNRNWEKSLDIPHKEILEEDDVRDMAEIRRRFIEIVSQGIKGYDLEKAREILASYNITQNPDQTLNGKPIYFTRYGETFINVGIPDASKTFKKNGQLLRDFNDHLLQIAVAYMKSEDKDIRNELASIYLTLTRHFLDQGFAAGSGQGTLHHLGYSMRNFYTAPVIMHDVLKEAGLAQEVQQAMEWFSGVGEVKTAPKEPGMDIDAFNTSLMGRVAAVLMLDDTPYKYAYMQALSRWIDNGFIHTEGLRPCFKTDGSVVHHRKSYPAYATGGFTGAVNAVWMLSGTGLSISEKNHENLKEALLAMRFYCNMRSFPLAMSGRHPDGKDGLIPQHYGRLADAGSPDRKEPIDTELAAAYLRLNGSKGKTAEKFIRAGIQPEQAPQGTRTFSFNCSLSHRIGGSLVTIAGHSRYLWAAETYNNANHYGRYLTHGSMQILPEGGSFEGGFAVDGWDWCHIPGTTAAEIPMAEMKSDVRNVDKHSGYEEMLLSDEWFAGGVTHNGRYGAFAMLLHEHDKYNGSLRARKSFFAFDDRIVCLGSDLENALPDAGLHTTLFQNTITPDMPTSVNSETICAMDYCDTLAADKLMLQDRHGNAYIIMDACVRVSRGMQHSLHEETDAPTQGYFEKAFILHGNEVKGASYEYLTLIAPDAACLNSHISAVQYEVIRHDTQVHAVKDIPTGVTGCAVYEEGAVDSLITGCTPAMLMYSIDKDRLTLSVSNPDLALYEGPSDEVFDNDGKRIERSIYGRTWVDNACAPVGVRITLKGLWETDSADCDTVILSYRDGNTSLAFTTREARTEEITLKRSER